MAKRKTSLTRTNLGVILKRPPRLQNRVHFELIRTSFNQLSGPQTLPPLFPSHKMLVNPVFPELFRTLVSNNHALGRGWISLSSFVSWLTVVMRAKRRRRAYSVRSRIASTPSSSPGLSQFGIGKVIVASVTQSSA